MTVKKIITDMEVYYDKNGNINGYADGRLSLWESIEEIRNV